MAPDNAPQSKSEPSVVSGSTSVLTSVKESVLDPSVFKTWPALPSAVGKLNDTPFDVRISLLPSDDTDSLASCNCSVGEPPESSKSNPVL